MTTKTKPRRTKSADPQQHCLPVAAVLVGGYGQGGARRKESGSRIRYCVRRYPPPAASERQVARSRRRKSDAISASHHGVHVVAVETS